MYLGPAHGPRKPAADGRGTGGSAFSSGPLLPFQGRKYGRRRIDCCERALDLQPYGDDWKYLAGIADAVKFEVENQGVGSV